MSRMFFGLRWLGSAWHHWHHAQGVVVADLALGIDDALRHALFLTASDSDVWIGDLSEIGLDKEIIPVRFAGLDDWFLFVSPHAETANDPAFLQLMMNNVDAELFPQRASRLVKFCRADAEAEQFKPEGWKLPQPCQIFQFAQVIRRVMNFYLDAMPEIQQFFYFPASSRLLRLYARVFRSLVTTRPERQIATLKGACHAYQRA